MNRLSIIQFLRTRTCQLGLMLILTLGIISIIIGKQFLNEQERRVALVVKKQKEHIARNIQFHGDDLGLLLYYLKFSLVKEQNPLSALSIGQSDLNPSIQNVKILTLEGQKYDSDLVNPTKLLFGNLDLSFILIYIFPLLIVAFTYNLLSEEKESGTWRMVSVSVRSKLIFLISKLLIRLILLLVVMSILFGFASLILGISWDEAFLSFFVISILYQLFWFALSFWIILLNRNSSFNAIILLSFWLTLVVLLPAIINSTVSTRYPVPEALSTMIKQRDGYHEKWDTNKKETMDKFYESYPQFKAFGYPTEEGFSWLWYYAMQHLGDDESSNESDAMKDKIFKRHELSKQLGRFFPSMHALLTFNELAETSLPHHMKFLERTDEFHENTRLFFYPKIFSQASSEEVNWEQFKPTFYENGNQRIEWVKIISPFVMAILVFLMLTVLCYHRNLNEART